MASTPDVTLDCQTCVAVNTTACSECVVAHLLANDDGPIAFVPAPVARVDRAARELGRAVALLERAGLLGDDRDDVSYDDFEQGRVPQLAP
ncbi:hypothetical protein [Ilumatobacter sp.]|uniref:hypothetical protein n=1 Tax=Ilumatobacter sp. TaxID=1967498 RepID=UPI003B52B5D6